MEIQDEDKVEERGLSPDTSETDSLQSGTSGGSGCLFPGDVGGQGRRKSSVCPQPLLPQATLLRFESQSSSEEGGARSYVRKELAALSEEEAEHNERLYEETMSLLFPEESMKDRFYRDKDKENAARLWILSITEDVEEEKIRKRKFSNIKEPEELNFLLKSGTVLCKLISKIYPECGIDVDRLETGNLNTKKKNISQFLTAALAYGLKEKDLFRPDDLVVVAHFHKVTRAIFALAERVKMDPTFEGQYLQYTNSNQQSSKRKASGNTDKKISTGTLNAIFENLMQDVERKTSVVSRGPPQNIYSTTFD